MASFTSLLRPEFYASPASTCRDLSNVVVLVSYTPDEQFTGDTDEMHDMSKNALTDFVVLALKTPDEYSTASANQMHSATKNALSSFSVVLLYTLGEQFKGRASERHSTSKDALQPCHAFIRSIHSTIFHTPPVRVAVRIRTLRDNDAIIRLADRVDATAHE